MIGYKKSFSEWQCLSEAKMGRGSPIPTMLRRKIVEQYQKGVTQRKTAKALHLSSSTVHNIIRRFRESGTISVRKGQGRKNILDARDLRALKRHCTTTRNATVKEITKWAQEYFGEHNPPCQPPLPAETLQCKEEAISKQDPQAQAFSLGQGSLKMEDCSVVRRVTVRSSFGNLGRRTKEDKDNPSCYQRSVQKPASLLVWGCMSVCGMGSLHVWKGTINAEKYIQLLEQHMLPSRRHVFQGRSCIFQQDNARPHSASII
uniref:Insertion element IS150 protein InsJ-like helix-turn-helix domain-containing protein n=1 Tax=Denticeps clupeoides TaxID=299321 RepID=A0AAY4DHR7_9TELE